MSSSNATKLKCLACGMIWILTGLGARRSMISVALPKMDESLYRAFHLWSHTGPFYRATVATHQMTIPDEILWRIALHWPDLGHNWNHVGWNLVAVDDSRSASCLPDLISSAYVLAVRGLLGDMVHRPHGLLEVTSGPGCHCGRSRPHFHFPLLLSTLCLSTHLLYFATARLVIVAGFFLLQRCLGKSQAVRSSVSMAKETTGMYNRPLNKLPR